MTRFLRKIGAVLALVALLFAQVAIAAYACPTKAGDVISMEGDARAPCHEMDREQVNLCKQHCEQNAQSVERATPVAIDTPAPLFVVVFTVNPLLLNVPSPRDFLVYDAGPSLSIRHCCFRI